MRTVRTTVSASQPPSIIRVSKLRIIFTRKLFFTISTVSVFDMVTVSNTAVGFVTTVSVTVIVFCWRIDGSIFIALRRCQFAPQLDSKIVARNNVMHSKFLLFLEFISIQNVKPFLALKVTLYCLYCVTPHLVILLS